MATPMVMFVCLYKSLLHLILHPGSKDNNLVPINCGKYIRFIPSHGPQDRSVPEQELRTAQTYANRNDL